MSNYIETPTMGEILSEEFFIPLSLSVYKVAREINVPTSRIQDIAERSEERRVGKEC